jgi:hypothetical protein
MHIGWSPLIACNIIGEGSMLIQLRSELVQTMREIFGNFIRECRLENSNSPNVLTMSGLELTPIAGTTHHNINLTNTTSI